MTELSPTTPRSPGLGAQVRPPKPERGRILVRLAWALLAALVVGGGVWYGVNESLKSIGGGPPQPSACPEWPGPVPSEEWRQTACFDWLEHGGFDMAVEAEAGYVAISGNPFGSTTAIWTSPDAVDWSAVPGTAGGRLHAVVSAAPGVVVVGQSTDASLSQDNVRVGSKRANKATDARVWFSPDGLKWSRVAPSAGIFGGAAMLDVTYTDGQYFAVGVTNEPWRPVVWSSADGVNWTRIDANGEHFEGAGMYAVTSTSSGLVALGHRPLGEAMAMVWNSSDGTHWELAAEGSDLFSGRAPLGGSASLVADFPGAIVAEREKLIVVGQRGLLRPKGAWLSLDNGHSWTKTSDLPGGNIVTVAGGFVATTLDAILFSPDGQDWSSVVSFDALELGAWSHRQIEPYSVAAVDNGLLVLGFNKNAGFFTGPHDKVIILGPSP